MDRLVNRIERVELLERTLYKTPGGIRVAALADRLGVHRSTIYRDIEVLSAIGVPVWQENGRLSILREGYLPPLRVNLHEALCIYLATRLLLAQSDKHNPHAVSALEKLAAIMPEPIEAHMTRTAELFQGRHSDVRYVEVLETLTRAWAERKQVRIRYLSTQASEARDRRFDPYFIEPSGIGHACYVIGRDHYRQEVRIFKVERIEQAVLTQVRYEIPEAFDPHRYLSTAWGIMGGESPTKVRLRFSPHITRRVKESVWHPSQNLQDLPDGGCVLTVEVSHWKEMKPWIRSWGPECKVLEPEELRREIAEDIDAAAALYGGGWLKERAARSSAGSEKQP